MVCSQGMNGIESFALYVTKAKAKIAFDLQVDSFVRLLPYDRTYEVGGVETNMRSDLLARLNAGKQDEVAAILPIIPGFDWRIIEVDLH